MVGGQSILGCQGFGRARLFHSRFHIYFGLLGAGALLMQAEPAAAQTEPLTVQLQRCIPFWEEGGNPNPAITPIKPEGYANRKSNRRMEVYLSFTRAAEVSQQAAKASLDRVEICRLEANGTATCPRRAPWLVFDRSQNIDLLPAPKNPEPTKDPELTSNKYLIPSMDPLGLDWDDPADQDLGLLIKVQRAGQAEESHAQSAQLHGLCPNAIRLAGGPADSLAVFGYAPSKQWFGQNACTGSRAEFTGDRCLNNAAASATERAEYIRKIVERADISLVTRTQALLGLPNSPNVQRPSWNGVIDGVRQPRRLLFIPSDIGVGGSATWSGFYAEVS